MYNQIHNQTCIYRGLIKNLQASGSLINDSKENLVQNHLRQVGLNLMDGKIDQLRNVGNLDTAEWLNDTGQILLQQRLIQGVEVTLDDWIFFQVIRVFYKSTFKVLEQTILICFGNLFNAFNLGSCKSRSRL